MMPIKTFVICACLVLSSGATQPDVLAKRDSSAEVDPYAAYYAAYDPSAAYPNDVEHAGVQTVSEKQGFANAMENVFGDDASLVLGTIGALMGTLAAVGVVLNNNNINSLSLDQDAICTVATNVAAIDLTLTTAAFAAAVPPTAAEITARLNLIETAVNGIAAPTRCA